MTCRARQGRQPLLQAGQCHPIIQWRPPVRTHLLCRAPRSLWRHLWLSSAVISLWQHPGRHVRAGRAWEQRASTPLSILSQLVFLLSANFKLPLALIVRRGQASKKRESSLRLCSQRSSLAPSFTPHFLRTHHQPPTVLCQPRTGPREPRNALFPGPSRPDAFSTPLGSYTLSHQPAPAWSPARLPSRASTRPGGRCPRRRPSTRPPSSSRAGASGRRRRRAAGAAGSTSSRRAARSSSSRSRRAPAAATLATRRRRWAPTLAPSRRCPRWRTCARPTSSRRGGTLAVGPATAARRAAPAPRRAAPRRRRRRRSCSCRRPVSCAPGTPAPTPAQVPARSTGGRRRAPRPSRSRARPRTTTPRQCRRVSPRSVLHGSCALLRSRASLKRLLSCAQRSRGFP